MSAMAAFAALMLPAFAAAPKEFTQRFMSASNDARAPVVMALEKQLAERQRWAKIFKRDRSWDLYRRELKGATELEAELDLLKTAWPPVWLDWDNIGSVGLLPRDLEFSVSVTQPPDRIIADLVVKAEWEYRYIGRQFLLKGAASTDNLVPGKRFGVDLPLGVTGKEKTEVGEVFVIEPLDMAGTGWHLYRP